MQEYGIRMGRVYKKIQPLESSIFIKTNSFILALAVENGAPISDKNPTPIIQHVFKEANEAATLLASAPHDLIFVYMMWLM